MSQRVRKRIADSDDDEYEGTPQLANKRQRTANQSEPVSEECQTPNSNDQGPQVLTEEKMKRFASQLVRMAISTQANRKVVSKEMVYQKIFSGLPLKGLERKRLFGNIVERAQVILRSTFCMELTLIPGNLSKEKDVAAAVGGSSKQQQATGAKKAQLSTDTYILTNILPKKIQRALEYDMPNEELEIMGLAFVVCTIIGGYGGTVTEATLKHQLELIHQDKTGEWLNGSIDDALKCLISLNYIKRDKDETSHETIKFKYSLGQRARVEFHAAGIANILRSVYDTELEPKSLASLNARLMDAGVPEGSVSDPEPESVNETPEN